MENYCLFNYIFYLHFEQKKKELYFMRIVTDKKKIENKCDLLYFKDGLIISKKLISLKLQRLT